MGERKHSKVICKGCGAEQFVKWNRINKGKLICINCNKIISDSEQIKNAKGMITRKRVIKELEPVNKSSR